ncbi:MAG: Gfo/Idh/MocA family protein [Anaerolineales bacterium]
MTKTLKVGIIGLGGIAHLHIGGWQTSEHTEVVAGCDITPAVFDQWDTEYGVKNLTTHAGDLINDPDIDIIDICTPNKTHADLTIAALDAGKHVLCEKPLAPTAEEIRRMIAARDRAGKTLMTAHHFRFTGTARALKAEIDLGVLGDIYHARAWWLRRAAVPLRPTFIYHKNSAGGVALDLGVHVLDLSLWFMGNPQPVAVTGIARTELASQEGAFSVWDGDIPQGFDVDEFAAAFVRFANGASFIIEASWMLHHNTDLEDVQIWLYGAKGGGHWPDCVVCEANNVTKQHYNRTLKRTEGNLRAHYQECVEFAQAVVDGAPPPVPAEQSLQVALILEALYQSQRTGREVVISETRRIS